MRTVKRFMVGIFALLLLVPLAAFRWEPGVASEIDNRMLAENPFSPEERAKGGDLTAGIENYVNDRIGLRDQMILGYTVLNDRLFGKMVHPSYCYGKDGYVFSNIKENIAYGDFHEAFADMVLELQNYCLDRGVPFVFAFEPWKTSALREYLPEGVNFDSSWVDRFLEALRDRGVRLVDNRETLLERQRAGEAVFNRVYDAGHWNDTGAFYGVNAILEELRKDFDAVHVNGMDEIRVSEELQTTLPGSAFPIHEYTPLYSFPGLEIESLTDAYVGEVRRNPSFQGFGYFVNPARQAEGAPRALVFQGSYMNERGRKFLMNGLGEYIYVHNYQNVLDIDYYFNIFRPECVVFEVTEYTVLNAYFDYQGMLDMDLNPALESALAEYGEPEVLPLEGISVQQGEALTVLSWTGAPAWIPPEEEEAVSEVPRVWAVLDGKPFDMRRSEAGGWEATVKNGDWSGSNPEICVLENGRLARLR